VSPVSRRLAQLAITGLLAISLVSPAIGAARLSSVRNLGVQTGAPISGLFVDLDSPDTIVPNAGFGNGVLENYSPTDSSIHSEWVQNQFDSNQLTALNFWATNTTTGHHWQFYLFPPMGQSLAVGLYTSPGAQPTATSAGLQMFSTDGTCFSGFTSDSWVRIDELTTAGDGTVSAYAATVSVKCDANTPLWVFDIRYQSSLGFVATRLAAPATQNERTMMVLGLDGTDVGSVVTRALEIENSGSEVLTLGILSLTGPDSAAYTLVDDSCSGRSITVGSACSGICLRQRL